MTYYDLDSESGVCPICGNHFGYGVVIDGICEDCYINQQTNERFDYGEDLKEEENEIRNKTRSSGTST